MHQLLPCDPLKIYVSHDTDLSQNILYGFHDAPSSGHLGRGNSYECQMNFGATPIYVGSQLHSIMQRVSACKACTF